MQARTRQPRTAREMLQASEASLSPDVQNWHKPSPRAGKEAGASWMMLAGQDRGHAAASKPALETIVLAGAGDGPPYPVVLYMVMISGVVTRRVLRRHQVRNGVLHCWRHPGAQEIS